MILLYSTKEVMNATGLSRSRCTQYAKFYNVKKKGGFYFWTQEELDDIKKRKREDKV